MRRLIRIYTVYHFVLDFLKDFPICNNGVVQIQRFYSDIIEAFNSISRYLDDLLNIDNIYFDQMVDRIYPKELPIK